MIDSKPPSIGLDQYMFNETRYRMLQQCNPKRAERLLTAAQEQVGAHWRLYEHLAAVQQREPGQPERSNRNA